MPQLMSTRTKICSRCGLEKLLTEFHRRNHYVRAGVRAACKECTSKEARQRRKAKPPRRDPIKDRVRARTREAIRRKELTPQPCRRCPSSEVEPHHPDYKAPDAHLRVDWLCPTHHAQEHGRRGWTKQIDLFPSGTVPTFSSPAAK